MTTKKYDDAWLATNQKKAYSQGHPRVGDNNDKYAKTTDFDWRSHVSGMSMWEVLQKQPRTADSCDEEWLSATHRFTW